MAGTGGTIFINYRKDDSNWNALALYNDLQKYFNRDQLFKDFNAILPGDDFVVSIQNALAKCNVLLVIIGKQWLNAKNADGTRRLEDPDDFVRLEIATALERGIQVVPVLFDDTPMPRQEELPENLRALCRRQFIEIESKRFDDDVRKLAEAIKKIMPAEAAVPPPPPRPVMQQVRPMGAHANQQTQQIPKPDNNLVWGIVTTILCCLPFGIVSIVHATKVDNLYANGHYMEAKAAADKAKQWAIYAAICGLVVLIIYVFVALSAGDFSSL